MILKFRRHTVKPIFELFINFLEKVFCLCAFEQTVVAVLCRACDFFQLFLNQIKSAGQIRILKREACVHVSVAVLLVRRVEMVQRVEDCWIAKCRIK